MSTSWLDQGRTVAGKLSGQLICSIIGDVPTCVSSPSMKAHPYMRACDGRSTWVMGTEAYLRVHTGCTDDRVAKELR